MLNKLIDPISCSKEFGMPSGHSSASVAMAIVCFLDLFYGSPIKSYEKFPKIPLTNYPSWFSYFFGILLALFWPITICFSRFILGAHSLD